MCIKLSKSTQYNIVIDYTQKKTNNDIVEIVEHSPLSIRSNEHQFFRFSFCGQDLYCIVHRFYCDQLKINNTNLIIGKWNGDLINNFSETISIFSNELQGIQIKTFICNDDVIQTRRV